MLGLRGPITHRVIEAWNAWLQLDLDRPGKTEHYLIEFMTLIAKMFAKDPATIHAKDFVLSFNRRKRHLTEEEAAEAAMLRWGMFAGGSLRVFHGERESYDEEPDYIISLSGAQEDGSDDDGA